MKGARKRRLQLTSVVSNKKSHSSTDPNVVGFDSDTDSDESFKSEEDEVPEIEEPNVLKISDEIEEVSVQNEGDNKVEEDNEVVITEKPPEVIEIKDAPAPVSKKPAVYVDVIRTEEIQAARMKLPILAEEQQIMEIINENSIIIVAGKLILQVGVKVRFNFCLCEVIIY